MYRDIESNTWWLFLLLNVTATIFVHLGSLAYSHDYAIWISQLSIISHNRACNLIYITFNDHGEIAIITRLRGNMLLEANINTSNVCHISIGVM